MTLDITPFLSIISGAVGGAASVGLFKGPIQTLEDWWYITFGYEKSEAAALLKEKQALNVEKMRNETLSEAAKILPENIQEPPLNILGPALEASKYYIEEEELRKMFAKLIASSMDKTKAPQVHPSFVEIIKQLSSKEALLLKDFNSRNPFAKIVLIEDKEDPSIEDFMSNDINSMEKISTMFGRKSKTILDYFYYSENNKDFLDNDFSISALNRLGLIQVESHIILSDNVAYNKLEEQFENFKDSPFMKLNKQHFTSEQHLELQKGSIDITPFGLFFCIACFN